MSQEHLDRSTLGMSQEHLHHIIRQLEQVSNAHRGSRDSAAMEVSHVCAVAAHVLGSQSVPARTFAAGHGQGLADAMKLFDACAASLANLQNTSKALHDEDSVAMMMLNVAKLAHGKGWSQDIFTGVAQAMWQDVKNMLDRERPPPQRPEDSPAS